ncbi:transmembrane protein 183-like [Mya arenaria]|uniref:transmembrane protein 183-like n=1 Tax=Mya arenaria TaxID=6604 RepID=UPI0022E5ECCF|nr:transmembrane protein 183-like [Mya arenaria]
MHKNFKNDKQRNRRFNSDITVNDYANAKPGRFSGLRHKKGATSQHLDIKVSNMVEVGEDVSWFDRDLDEFDVTLDCGEEVQVGEEQRRKRTPRKCMRLQEHEDQPGVDYPLDLWFLLSRYIHPESVSVFAVLCRGTNIAVISAQFWKHLYLRYYIDETNIPDELRMTSIECIHGLRARTIKMLHFVYPPLVMRTKTSMPFENEPHCLVGQRCLLTWHRKMRNGWKFYLRFRKGDEADLSSNEQKALKSPGFMKWHQDLFYNPDEGASVLEVTCQNYSPLPMVMGLILNRVYLNVSSGSMRYHRLKLVMDSSYRATTAKNQGSMQELVLDPVLEVKVFPWWHPAFADSQSMLMETEA